MTTHTAHPKTHEEGLADECPRCAEHAQHPLESLDSTNLNQLWQRMVAFEFTHVDDEVYRPRSGAEGTAMRVMLEHARFLRMIGWTTAELEHVTF